MSSLMDRWLCGILESLSEISVKDLSYNIYSDWAKLSNNSHVEGKRSQIKYHIATYFTFIIVPDQLLLDSHRQILVLEDRACTILGYGMVGVV